MASLSFSRSACCDVRRFGCGDCPPESHSLLSAIGFRIRMKRASIYAFFGTSLRLRLFCLQRYLRGSRYFHVGKPEAKNLNKRRVRGHGSNEDDNSTYTRTNETETTLLSIYAIRHCIHVYACIMGTNTSRTESRRLFLRFLQSSCTSPIPRKPITKLMVWSVPRSRCPVFLAFETSARCSRRLPSASFRSFCLKNAFTRALSASGKRPNNPSHCRFRCCE